MKLVLEVLKGRPIILIIDETGDQKKGKTTDYVKRQYIGNLAKVENGVVAVTAYSLFCGMTFPLVWEISQPRQKLKPEDKYFTKPQSGAMLSAKATVDGVQLQLGTS